MILIKYNYVTTSECYTTVKIIQVETSYPLFGSKTIILTRIPSTCYSHV